MDSRHPVSRQRNPATIINIRSVLLDICRRRAAVEPNHCRVKYIFYLESIRPIRTAENFEAVEWAPCFSKQTWLHCGII